MSESESEHEISAIINSVSKHPKTKSVNLKVEGVNIDMIVDSGSSVNIIDKESFRKIQQKLKREIKVKSSKAKLCPYASKPIKTIGYFETIIKSTLRVSAQKVYIVNKEKEKEKEKASTFYKSNVKANMKKPKRDKYTWLKI